MSVAELETISVEVDGDVAVIYLDRPEQRNSFTVTMGRELAKAFRSVDENPQLRAVVLTGRGSTFCVGGDLNQSGGAAFKRKSSTTSQPKPPFRDPGGVLTLQMFELSKPIIAAINGSAVGIGLTMTLAADIRVASDRAKFGFPFAARGIVPDGTSSWLLPRLVGLSTALEWALSGRIFTGDEALRTRLVHSLHPPDEVLAAAVTMAKTIAKTCAPVSVALTRQMFLRNAGVSSLAEAHRIESMGLEFTGASPDTIEGVKAFIERRDPVWRMAVPGDLPEWYPWWHEPDDGEP